TTFAVDTYPVTWHPLRVYGAPTSTRFELPTAAPVTVSVTVAVFPASTVPVAAPLEVGCQVVVPCNSRLLSRQLFDRLGTGYAPPFGPDFLRATRLPVGVPPKKSAVAVSM